MPIARRSFLCGSLALAFAGEEWRAQQASAQERGLILRQKEPENLESPFAALDGFITPSDRFFVRNHFAVPKIEAKDWKLKIEGAVEKPLELTYEDLVKLPSRIQPAVLECAGNGRIFLVPGVRGLQWEMGAVGNAEWTGASLGTLLEKVGVRPGAVEVVLEGADRGEIRDDPKSAGVIPFARSIPINRARQRAVLLAYKLNGVNLTPAHGFPVRAIVPGYYGVASVKWLTRIIVLERAFHGYFQSFDYTYWQRDQAGAALRPVAELQVKAQIARPAMHEKVAKGSKYRIYGAAWTGDSEVSMVEVSTDGGRSWKEARLLDPDARYTWRRWDYDWRTPEVAGTTKLMARATDKRGQTQPLERDPDRRTYMISHVLPIDVEVR